MGNEERGALTTSIMPLSVSKTVSSGSGKKSSSSVEEQDISPLPEGPAWLDASPQDTSTWQGVYPPQASFSQPLEVAYFPLEGDPGPDGGSSNDPGSVVAVTSGGITFNLTFDSFAPSSFRAGIQQAASILTAAISDQITVNLSIHYTGSGGGAFAGPANGLFESYSATTAALTSHASLGDTIFNALPGGLSIQGQSQVAVWNAQLKALGFLSANASGSDGSATFATDINSNLLVGVALHELSHAMGRIPYGSPSPDPVGRPDIFDLFRFTSAGSRLFTGSVNSAPPAYFSVDGGFTGLADYGRTSDTSDFLNSGVQGPNDPFNEFYTGSTSQQLSNVDLLQLDALGFHLTSNASVTIEAFGSTSLVRASNQTYYLPPVGGSGGPQLKYGGAPVVVGGAFGAYTAIGAEAISGGYEIAWKIPGVDQFSVWNADSNGNLTSTPTGTIFGNSSTLEIYESSFHQDLNSDGVVGPVITTIETSGSTSLLIVGNNYLLGGLSGPQVKLSAAPVVAGQFGAWTPIGAEQMASSGYEIVWKFGSADQYVVWNTDSSGNWLWQSPVVSAASPTVQSLEPGMLQDFNANGATPSTTVMEQAGSTKLVQISTVYLLYPVAGSVGPQLKYNGAVVTAGEFGASWTPLGAEATASGYQVVWKNGGNDQYIVWTTNNIGNWLSQSAVLSGGSYVVESLETTFGQDLNGDGTTGPVTTGIESSGVTTLDRLGDTFFLYANGTTTGPQLKYMGAMVTVGQFGAWTPLGAEKTASGYQIVWNNGGADQYIAWNTDNSGNWLSQSAVLSGGSYVVESLETTFGQNFNGDGTIGPVTTVIESSGVTTLDRLGDTYFLYANGTTTGPQLKYAGAMVTVGEFGAWTPLGAEKTASGYQLVWKNTGTNQYIAWNTDGSGNWQSQGAAVGSTDFGLESLETTFGQDLNVDGTTGPVMTNIEAAGGTTLAQVANTYFMYGHGTTTGPQLKYAGAMVTVGEFGAWTPLGAEKIGSGYELVWKNVGNDQYLMWNTDGNGNWLTQTGIVGGNSPTLKGWETTFSQDFNANSVVGATGPLTTSSDGSGDPVAPTVVLTYDPSSDGGNTADGNDRNDPIAPTAILFYGPPAQTGNGSSGSVNLPLLTNYLASTFVPPSGQATGSVVAAQSSDQEFLAKPTA